MRTATINEQTTLSLHDKGEWPVEEKIEKLMKN